MPDYVETWTDHNGAVWLVPQIRGRLKMRIPAHRALREFVLQRDKVCQRCSSAEDLVADHIVSRRNGGSHAPDNLQALCQRCNSRKSSLEDAKAGLH